jgi:hypothetical protein
MNAKKKAARGGARPGAGRPKKYEDATRVTYWFPQALLDQIEEERGEQSANEWVVSTLSWITRPKAPTKGKAKKGE